MDSVSSSGWGVSIPYQPSMYKVKNTISLDGVIYAIGDSIELTEEQATELADSIELTEEQEAPKKAKAK